jgi:2-oxo-3-hexenedioate decarboxylase/2-keto-4-pentenoate hydratase
VALDPAQLLSAAVALRAAERDVAPIAPVTERFPGLDVADAYAIQLLNVAGRPIAGHKVGLTAQAMRDMLGVDEPDYGHLLDDMVLADGATVEWAGLCQPRVEPEITFILDRGLRGPGVTAADVRAATRAVVASIEIPCSRIADWRITLADTIADNASAGVMVRGADPKRLDDLPPLADLACELVVNGAVVATGSGASVLGDPARAVAWLANTLGPLGVTLEPGHLVMPGSCTAAPLVRAGDRVEARFEALGSASVTLV